MPSTCSCRPRRFHTLPRPRSAWLSRAQGALAVALLERAAQEGADQVVALVGGVHALAEAAQEAAPRERGEERARVVEAAHALGQRGVEAVERGGALEQPARVLAQAA